MLAAMSLKEWLGQLQPAPLYTLLALTVTLFAGQLALSHFSHALTLLMDSYHVLCNIIALAGTIITIKVGGRRSDSEVGDTAAPGSPPKPCYFERFYCDSSQGCPSVR